MAWRTLTFTGENNMFEKKPLAQAIGAISVAATMSCIPTIAAADESELEEIVVTGSRIATEDGYSRVSPVTVVTREDIESVGLTRMEDVLNQLPSIETASNSMDVNGATGTASLDLRGLGSSRTLVLINGRRMQGGGIYASSPDINQIPAGMVERVEVLTGGASTTYGADAVAGVVNFVTRKVDGVEISAGVSAYNHKNSNTYVQGLLDARNFTYPTGNTTDGRTENLDIIIGGDFAEGRGNATVYATWRENDALLQGQRDYSSCALTGASTSCGGSANAIVPNFFIAPITADGYDYSAEQFLTMQSDGSLAAWDGTNRYNYGPVNHYMRPDERWSVGAMTDYQITDNTTVYGEFMYASNKTRAQIAESGTFFAEMYELPLTNEYFAAPFKASLEELFPGEENFGVYIGKRNVEGGKRVSVLGHDALRLVVGFEGDINDSWSYDVSYQYGQSSSSTVYLNDFFAPKIKTAVNSTLCEADSSCIPYQVFTYQGVTSEAASNMTGVASMTGTTSQSVTGGFVTGVLPDAMALADDAPIVVFGFEIRDDKYERIADTVFSEGQLLGQGGATKGVAGSIDVKELYFEASIPVMQDESAGDLTVDLGYRYSDYSTNLTEDLYTADTYKAGINWQPMETMTIRAGFNHAVRAPTVFNLFSETTFGLWGGADGCATDAPTFTQAQCANTGVTAAQYGTINASPADQYNLQGGGNPNLGAESADTITFGVVMNPIENLTFSVDYWDVEIEGTIAGLGAQLTLDLCATTGSADYCNLVNRAANGSLWQGTAGYINTAVTNLGEKHWEGMDLEGDYMMSLGEGTLSISAIATLMMTKETTPVPADTSTIYDCTGVISDKCYPTPDWRGTVTAIYDSGDAWTLGAKVRLFGEVEYTGDTDQIANDSLSGIQNYFDVFGTYTFLEDDNATFRVGINNILDEEPPLVGGTLATNANSIAGFYDTLGRFMYGKFTYKL